MPNVLPGQQIRNDIMSPTNIMRLDDRDQIQAHILESPILQLRNIER